MDKNGNGPTAQFSPEELIRRLKSQLNINTEQESEETEKTSDKVDNVESSEGENIEFTEVESVSETNDIAQAVSDSEVVGDRASTVESEHAEGDEIVFEIDDNDSISDESETHNNVINDLDSDESSNASSTVEFSISDLFGKNDMTEGAVEEVSVDDSDNKQADDANDELDFISFLAASGISKDKSDTGGALAENVTDNTVVNDTVDDPEEEQQDEVADTFDTEVSDGDDGFFDDFDAFDCEDENKTLNDETESFADDSNAAPEDKEDVDFVAETADTAENAVDKYESKTDEFDYSFDDDTPAAAASNDESKTLPDFNMLIALGIPVAEVEKIYGSEAAEEYARLTEGTNALDDLSDDEEEYEYTSRAQNEEIEAHHKSEKKLSFVKLCAAAVLFIIALLYENLPALGAEYSGWMDQSAFPVVHIMVDLQLVLFAAVLAWDELVSGIKALLRRTANVGTVLAAAVIINIICDIALCFTRVAKYEVKLAGASVIFAILMCLGISALRLFAEIKAFAMISQKGTRACVLNESVDDIRERNAFFDKISKDEASSAKVLSFGKTKFVSGFFRNQTSDRATVIDKILAPAAIVGAIIAFVIAYVVSKSVGIGLYTFNCAAAFLVPVSVFAAGTITYAKAASYAESMKAAIIGENAPYDLADSSVVAFEDRDAYPSYCVKLRNLKVYGNIAIVDVLRMTTTAFRKIGGPLSDVLESATSEVNKDIPVDIVKSCEGGVEAVYQGQRLLIGKADFLHSYGIIPYSDVDDREYLKTGDVSIMYVAYGDELSAKFYIQYTLDVDFEVLLRDLNRAGICVSIRTSDPNIDKRLLQAKLNLNKTSLRIVYRDPADGRSEPTEETASAVVGTGTPSELIHTAMLCDRVVHVYRTNTIVKAISLVIGLALLVLFALISVNVNVFSGLLIIYQLFWMIPTLIVSKLFL